MTYSEQEIIDMNKTNRSNGAIGNNAIVPRLVEDILKRIDYRALVVLDYGAGKEAKHVLNLRKTGHIISGHEIGDNFNPDLHVANVMTMNVKFDLIYASNTLNVQPHERGVLAMLDDIHSHLKPGGWFIANYPASPRKSDISAKVLAQWIKNTFQCEPELIHGTKSVPVWKVIKSLI
jgi:hypothetical protein